MHVHKTEPPKGPKGWIRRYKAWYHHLSKKQKILFFSAITTLVLLIGSGLVWAFVLNKPEPPPPPPKKVVKEPEPTTKPSCLIGKQIPIASNPLPTGIMIENSPSARPQSGLYDAEVVFEAIAEGGITRFLTLFETSKPTYVGPVRSIRPYYLDFLLPFDAPIAHAGGSAEALAKVSKAPFKDLEAFRYPNYYQRVSSRFAPHNLYTNRANLINLQKDLGWKTSKCEGFVRLEKETEPEGQVTAQTINLDISSVNYNVAYKYHKKTNSYQRSMGGQPHVDETAKQQIRPKVVIVPVMSHRYAGIYSVYGNVGSGKVFIFQDGKVHKGTWHRLNKQSQYTFRDSNKNPIKLNPGKAWVTIVSSPDKVTYQPAPQSAAPPAQ